MVLSANGTQLSNGRNAIYFVPLSCILKHVLMIVILSTVGANKNFIVWVSTNLIRLLIAFSPKFKSEPHNAE